jgi:hypothetical protein
MIDWNASNLPSSEPGKVARSTLTIQGTAQDLQFLRDAIDVALNGGPGVMEGRSISGCEQRFLIDRIGPALKGN